MKFALPKKCCLNIHTYIYIYIYWLYYTYIHIYIYMCVCVCVCDQNERHVTQDQFLKRTLNEELSVSHISCHIKVKEPILPYYFPITGVIVIGCTSFSKVLALCEMQTVSPRIWTRVVMFIYNDDYHCTTSTSSFIYIYIYIYIYILSSTDRLFRCITTLQCS